MWRLVAGGAAILLGGAYILCKTLEEENERKEEELARTTEKYIRELNAQREELERISSMNDKAEQLHRKQQLFIALQQESQRAYQTYLDGRKQIAELKTQLKATIQAKKKAKKELNRLKAETFMDKIRRLFGCPVSKEESPKFQVILKQLRDYNAFYRNLWIRVDKKKQLLKTYHSDLQRINHQTHALNLERKQLRDEDSQSMVCIDCGKSFSLKVGELLFFKEKGFQFPKRCPTCRAGKKRK